MANSFSNLTIYIGYFLASVLIVLLVWVIHRQIREYHLQDDPMLYTLKEVLKPLHPIVDSLKLYRGSKSYTINKDKIFLCLYDENGEYYSLNSLIYVLTHEIAHKINNHDVGHTETFHKIFQDLLDRATKLGIYNPNIPMDPNYCTYND